MTFTNFKQAPYKFIIILVCAACLVSHYKTISNLQYVLGDEAEVLISIKSTLKHFYPKLNSEESYFTAMGGLDHGFGGVDTQHSWLYSYYGAAAMLLTNKIGLLKLIYLLPLFFSIFLGFNFLKKSSENDLQTFSYFFLSLTPYALNISDDIRYFSLMILSLTIAHIGFLKKSRNQLCIGLMIGFLNHYAIFLIITLSYILTDYLIQKRKIFDILKSYSLLVAFFIIYLTLFPPPGSELVSTISIIQKMQINLERLLHVNLNLLIFFCTVGFSLLFRRTKSGLLTITSMSLLFIALNFGHLLIRERHFFQFVALVPFILAELIPKIKIMQLRVLIIAILLCLPIFLQIYFPNKINSYQNHPLIKAIKYIEHNSPNNQLIKVYANWGCREILANSLKLICVNRNDSLFLEYKELKNNIEYKNYMKADFIIFDHLAHENAKIKKTWLSPSFSQLNNPTPFGFKIAFKVGKITVSEKEN